MYGLTLLLTILRNFIIPSLLALPVLFLTFIYSRPLFTSFRNVPGPSASHWLLGNLLDLANPPTGTFQSLWAKKYGPVIRYSSIFRRPEIMVADPLAVKYIYDHPELFHQTDGAKTQALNLTGKSLLWATGEDHRRMRKAIAPSFAPAHLRELMVVSYAKAAEAKDRLMAMGAGEGSGVEKKEGKGEVDGVELDISRLVNQITIDVIGLAGFDHDFGSLGQGEGELLEAWRSMLMALRDRSFLAILQFTGVLGIVRIWRTKRQDAIDRARGMMREVGKPWIEAKRREIMLESQVSGKVNKGEIVAKDLIHVLMRANMSADLSASQKLSDEEVLSQIPLFLLAGNVTTSSALTWAFIELARNPGIQDKLRKEVAQVEDEPPLNTLNALPYLEAFTREILRMYPTVPDQSRQPAQTTILPLSQPIRGRDGQMMDSVVLDKGTQVFIPFLYLNTCREVWGPDGGVFDPERFMGATPATGRDGLPGVWGDILTFGGGDRSCIGYRFALAEIKAVLFVLVRHFIFTLPAWQPIFDRFGGIGISRPRVVGEAAPRAPLVVRPIAV